MRYYKRIDTAGKTTTVESYSHDGQVVGAIEIDKQEFDSFIASLPVVPYDPATFESPLDKLIKRVEIIEAKIKAV